jgi:hypothetical protein
VPTHPLLSNENLSMRTAGDLMDPEATNSPRYVKNFVACKFYTVFRRVRKIAKSDYSFRYVYLSVCPNGTTGLPLDGFSLNLTLMNFSKNLPTKLKFH